MPHKQGHKGRLRPLLTSILNREGRQSTSKALEEEKKMPARAVSSAPWLQTKKRPLRRLGRLRRRIVFVSGMRLQLPTTGYTFRGPRVRQQQEGRFLLFCSQRLLGADYANAYALS